jgi:hypothetical protein
VFIQSDAKDPRGGIPAMRATAGLKQAHKLAGPTGFITYVESEGQDTIAESVFALRLLAGVATTDTRFVILD